MGRAERGYKVGWHIRQLRERQGLSQAEVAEKTGLSPGFISHVENDRRAASGAALLSILKEALNVQHLSEFFAQIEAGERPVCRRDDGVPLVGPGEPIRIEFVGPRAGDFDFCLHSIEMEPDYEASSVDRDPQDLSLTVLEGRLGITIDDEEYELGPGDTCFVAAFRQHRARNLAAGHTRFIQVQSNRSHEEPPDEDTIPAVAERESAADEGR